MDTSNEMVSTNFKLSFKYKDNFISIGAEAAVFVKTGEALESAFKRSWDSVQVTVDNQIQNTVASLVNTEEKK